MGFRTAFYSDGGEDDADNKCGRLSAAGFGEVIRARRKELHYTQGFLSEFSGLSVSFISDLENGKKTAELEKAIYLANLLGLDLCLEGREHGA